MSGARILLVEDEAISARHEATMLRARGYEVVEAPSGEAALSMAAHGAGNFDLVLMDIALGDGMDGFEAARRIMALRDLPVVFLSVHSDEETIAKAESIGPYGFVAKDSGVGVIDASIRLALRLHQARADLSSRHEELADKVETLRAVNDSLAASEARFSRLFELTPAAIIISRAEDGLILNVNDSFCRLFGRRQEELIGHSTLPGSLGIWNRVEERERFVGSLEERGEADGIEAEFRLPDGGLFLGSISGRFIEVEGSRWMLSVVEDITERRKAEEALERLSRIESFVSKAAQLMLREADERSLLEGACRIAVEAGAFGMAWIGLVAGDGGSIRGVAGANLLADDLDGIVVRLSGPEAGRGLAGRAVLARKPLKCMDIEADEAFGPWQEGCLARGYRSAAAFPLIAAGRLIGVYAVYSRQAGVFGEAEMGLLESLATDIAFALDLRRAEKEREEAERKARESDLLYRESFMQSSAVKLLVDPADGGIVDANPAASAFYGYSIEALKAMSVADLNASTPEAVRANIARVRSGRTDRFEARHRLASGEVRDVEVFSSPIRIGGRELLHSIVHDVTEKKLAEARLERLVSEKETLMKELQHRVKNNLNVVIGLLSLEADRCRDGEARKALSEAITRVGSIASVYEKLYASADLASIDLGPYVEELAASIFAAYSLDPARVSLRTDVDPLRLEPKRCVPFGLVLNELVSNALKYAYPGEASGEVRVELRSRDGRVSLLVEDDGPGVPEAFRREDADSMGMVLVRMLAGQLGGRFELDCGPTGATGGPGRRGTRARLEFPA